MKKMPHPSKYSQRDIDQARADAAEILKNEGGVLEDSPHDYQCFTYREDRVCLVFYPHRTSAWNYHTRVRDQGSKDKARADALMKKLDDGDRLWRSFPRKI